MTVNDVWNRTIFQLSFVPIKRAPVCVHVGRFFSLCRCDLSWLLVGGAFNPPTGSKIVCVVFSGCRRCSRSSPECFLCGAGRCRRNQTQGLFWCETDLQPRPVSHALLQPFVWRLLQVCCVRRSRWAVSSAMVIAGGNPPGALARPAFTGADLHSQQWKKTPLQGLLFLTLWP